MTGDEQNRVLIIGAGPAGLSLAVALDRARIPCSVFERAPELHEVGAGLGIQTNAMRSLIQIGVGDALLARGTSVDQQIYTDSGQLLGHLPYDRLARERGAPGVTIVRRTDLQRALLQAFGTERIRLGTECVAVEEDESSATAVFADGTRERGALLVGADGLRSVVRPAIHGQHPPRYSGFTSWRGITSEEPAAGESNIFKLYIGPGAQFAIFPLVDATYWSGTLVTPEGERDAPDGKKAEILRHFRHFPSPAAMLVESTSEEEIIRTDIYDRDPIRPWSKGRLVLIGDAAHPTTPFEGQGASMGIEDAVVLAKELSVSTPFTDAESLELSLVAFEERRAERAAATVIKSRGNGESYKLTGIKCTARNVGMRALLPRRARKVVEQSLEFH